MLHLCFKELAPRGRFELPVSEFRAQRVASYTISEQRANDRTRTCIDESHNLAPDPFGHVRHQTAGMERLELSKPGLKNLSRDRFAFIPVSVRQTSVCRRLPYGEHSASNDKLKFAGHSRCGRGESNSQDARFKRAMSAGCITPAHSLLHASRFTHHELVAESGVAPDDLLVMSQPSLVPAPSPHQEHAVRFEPTISGFADRRLNRLGYACH